MCGSHVLSIFAMTNYSISLYLTTFEPKSINIHFIACTTFGEVAKHYADMVIELRDRHRRRRLWPSVHTLVLIPILSRRHSFHFFTFAKLPQ